MKQSLYFAAEGLLYVKNFLGYAFHSPETTFDCSFQQKIKY